MRILIAGASGTIGAIVASAFSGKHEVIRAGRSSGDVKVDLSDRASVDAMYKAVGKIDAAIACAGHVHFGPLAEMTSEQFKKGLDDKLMGSVNFVLAGLNHVADGGSFTLTSGILDRDPIRKGVNASTVNAALAGFVMSAAIEMPRGLRINVVSPGLLEASVKKYEGFFPGHEPVAAERVALAYIKSVEGAITGQVIRVG